MVAKTNLVNLAMPDDQKQTHNSQDQLSTRFSAV